MMKNMSKIFPLAGYQKTLRVKCLTSKFPAGNGAAGIPIEEEKTMKVKRTKGRIFLAALLVCLTLSHLYPIIMLNGSSGGLCDGAYALLSAGCEGDMNAKTNSASNAASIIEEAGGKYLKAYSGVMQLLSMAELANLEGADFKEMARVVGNAHTDLSHAASMYALLVSVTRDMSYNQVVLKKLSEFDYSKFMSSNRLNPLIFNDVQTFLANGDIKGTYKRVYNSVLLCEDKMDLILEKVSAMQLPPIELLWEVNELLSENMLFSQYLARVFKEIIRGDI